MSGRSESSRGSGRSLCNARAGLRIMLCVLACATTAGAPLPVASQGLPEFSGTEAVSFDSHVHSGNSTTFDCLDDPNLDLGAGCHSMRWCGDAYEAARLRGLRALILSHHSNDLSVGPGSRLDSWTSHGDAGFTDPYGNDWPTHSAGYPLVVSGGHTDDEVDALWECAELYTSAEFLALYGIEYTAANPLFPGCDSSGQADCGGHKVGVPATKPDIRCGTTSHPGDCSTEVEFYAWLDQTAGVAGAAHPATGIPAEWAPYDPTTRPGGASAEHLFWFELSVTWEDQPCFDDSSNPPAPPSVGCGYRQVLALGYNLAPFAGSDNHLCPLSQDPTGCGAGFWENWIYGQRRTVCMVDEFSREGLFEAIRARRCFWAQNGTPTLHFTVESTPMGEEVTPVAALEYALFVEPDALDVSGGWEIVCGAVTGDGGDGGAAVVASGSCPAIGTCSAAGAFSPEAHEWCYLRLAAPNRTLALLSAPVVLRALPVPTLGPAGLWILGLGTAGGLAACAARRGARRRSAPRGGPGSQ